MTLKQNNLKLVFLLFMLILVGSCGIYSFTGASIPAGVTTFQVNFFENKAGNRPGSTVEPGLDNEFTVALQDLIMNQTNLDLVTTDGQLIYEGEIT
ncbi:LPS assembly lipoprotein LptE, partial [Flavobacteriaceae bacterium]|nr:LPS assembly lipoprotein LptE [Flavobacteriaceae bacterium]